MDSNRVALVDHPMQIKELGQLQINSKQMDELDSAVRRIFHRKLLHSLRVEIPDHLAYQDDTDLLDCIAGLHETANRYNIRTEKAVVQFVVLNILAGTAFLQSDAIQRYLSDTALTGSQKMRLLLNMIEAEQEKT